MTRATVGAATLALAVTLALGPVRDSNAAAEGAPAAQQPRPPLGPSIYKLDDQTMLRWPLPPGQEKYGKIDGFKMKPTVDKLVAIAEKSRKDGHQWWGRITGTPYYDETQDWIESEFKRIGLQTRRQEFELPPVWFPESWAITASAGGQTITLKSVQPTLRSPGTTDQGIDAEAVYVGLGSIAETKGRDLKGKIVFVQSTPVPGALRHTASVEGTMRRLQLSGAAAVVMILALPGNVATQLWGYYDEEQTLDPVPTFSLGLEDGTAVRRMFETTPSVKAHVTLRVQNRTGLKPQAVWGVLPGRTDENIFVMAHPDGFFQGALDNASGVAAMLGLAEYYASIPKEQRRRTITFFSTVGHHVSKDFGLIWMHDNMKDFWAKTAVAINAEHVAAQQVYKFDRILVRTNAAIAHRHYVGGTATLKDIVFKDFSLFGVGLYNGTNIIPTGDMLRLYDAVPGIEVIESNEFYHSDMDIDSVPAVGLEAITRAYAKVIDDVNQLELSQLRETK
jgi:hypothetical protein